MTLKELRQIQDDIDTLELEIDDVKKNSNIYTMEKELKIMKTNLQFLLQSAINEGKKVEGNLHIVNKGRTYRKVSLFKLSNYDSDLFNAFVGSPQGTADIKKFTEWIDAGIDDIDMDAIVTETTKNNYQLVEV